MRRLFLYAVLFSAFSILLFFQFSCSENDKAKPKTHEEIVALGKYIVHTG